MPAWSITATSAGPSRLTRCLVRFPSRTRPENVATGCARPWVTVAGGGALKVCDFVRGTAMRALLTSPRRTPPAAKSTCLPGGLCRRRQQFLCVTPGPRVGAVGAEHPAELGDDLGPFERLDSSERRVHAGVLLDPQVRVRERGDLRQMGDAEDLATLAEPPQALPHGTCGLPPDPGVDLIEDERPSAAGVRHAHQGEHHARELAA